MYVVNKCLSDGCSTSVCDLVTGSLAGAAAAAVAEAAAVAIAAAMAAAAVTAAAAVVELLKLQWR